MLDPDVQFPFTTSVPRVDARKFPLLDEEGIGDRNPFAYVFSRSSHARLASFSDPRRECIPCADTGNVDSTPTFICSSLAPDSEACRLLVRGGGGSPDAATAAAMVAEDDTKLPLRDLFPIAAAAADVASFDPNG